MELYGCVYIEVLDRWWRVSKIDYLSYLSDLEELKEERYRISKREFENEYRFKFAADPKQPIFIESFDVDKFDKDETIKYQGEEYRVIHHTFDPESNVQIVVIDKRLKDIPINKDELHAYRQNFEDNKKAELKTINEVINENLDEYTKGKSKGFFARMFE